MKLLRLVIVGLLLCLLVVGCGSPNYQMARKQNGILWTVTEPYTNSRDFKVVLLVWETPIDVTPEQGQPSRPCQCWEAIISDKIPPSFVGHYVGEKVNLTYRLVMLGNPPLIRIIDITTER